MELPPFNAAGLLPPGDHPLTLEELRASYLVDGRGVVSSAWDTAWRQRLVANLAVLVQQLWRVGIIDIYIDGSFVEAKDHPNDIDGYFACDVRDLATGQLARDLNALDPHRIWTWAPASRLADPDSGKAQLPMWHQYRVELYPHFGQPSGIRDRFGHELLFPAAFRCSRQGHQPKGIVRLIQ